MRAMHFIAGCALGFALATSIVFLIFCTFLCGKALLALLAAPSHSLGLLKEYPEMFWPLLRIFLAEIILVVLSALLLKAYRNYMGKKPEKKQVVLQDDDWAE